MKSNSLFPVAEYFHIIFIAGILHLKNVVPNDNHLCRSAPFCRMGRLSERSPMASSMSIQWGMGFSLRICWTRHRRGGYHPPAKRSPHQLVPVWASFIECFLNTESIAVLFFRQNSAMLFRNRSMLRAGVVSSKPGFSLARNMDGGRHRKKFQAYLPRANAIGTGLLHLCVLFA